MNARIALAVLLLLTGRVGAGEIDKAKLRKLAELPTVTVVAGVGFSTTSGFTFNDEKPDPAAEIVRLRKQLQGDATDAERYQRLGLLYHKIDQKKASEEAYAKAVALCRRQVREHPEDKRWLARLGDALVATDQADEGEKLLRRAIREAPEDWRAWLALAQCLDGRAVHAVTGDEGFTLRFASEKLIVSTLLKKKPTAQQIAQMRRLHKEARACYDRAVTLAPRETKPYFWRAASSWGHGAIEAGLRMAKVEKADLVAALLTPDVAADMSRVARLSPDDPRLSGWRCSWRS